MRVSRWLRAVRVAVLGSAPATVPLLLLVGALLLVVGGVFGLREWSATRGMVRAESTVTENVARFAAGGGVVYSPRLRFRTGDGEIVQVVVQREDEEAAFATGESVPVMYRVGDPQHAQLATAWSLYATAIVVAVVGVVVFDAGLILLLLVRRRRG